MGTKHYTKLYNKSRKWLITVVLSIVIVTNTFLVSTTAWAAKTPTPKPTSPSNAESYQADANSTTVATSSSSATTASSSATQSSSATATNPPSTAPYHHHHATVTVRYVDQTGKLLATGTADYPFGPFVGWPYTTHPQSINNYHFVRMGAGSLPATGILSHHGDNGIVTYVYAPAYHLTTKTINEYVEYVDENGKALTNPYRARPVTFATVADVLHHTTVTYFSRTKTTLTLDQQG
ncbi:MucBP domain-containing protein [Pediococcus pentosaceus]|uniref:MucBP domain-containing protein n=1 Tax=Pediococcus pentosaceus TaxID=1255 RepID=UPI001E42EF5D|nr:MucBP domain-containing protein [Pediococcus pentosaceus]